MNGTYQQLFNSVAEDSDLPIRLSEREGHSPLCPQKRTSMLGMIMLIIVLLVSNVHLLLDVDASSVSLERRAPVRPELRTCRSMSLQGINHQFALQSFRFFPGAFLAGEWWRIVTYPFVHVSWYHLMLDASAFLFLLFSLEEKRTVIRVFYVGCCSLFSIAVTWLTTPGLVQYGLCGLSGIDHGLMALVGLELIYYHRKDKALSWVGWLTLLSIVGKSIVEACSGSVIFSFLHTGNVGYPLTMCHIGGVLGGIVGFYVMKNVRLFRKSLYQAKRFDILKGMI